MSQQFWNFTSSGISVSVLVLDARVSEFSEIGVLVPDIIVLGSSSGRRGGGPSCPGGPVLRSPACNRNWSAKSSVQSWWSMLVSFDLAWQADSFAPISQIRARRDDHFCPSSSCLCPRISRIARPGPVTSYQGWSGRDPRSPEIQCLKSDGPDHLAKPIKITLILFQDQNETKTELVPKF